jgi:hypothetical protein
VDRTAVLVKQLAGKYGIPLKRLKNAELLAGQKGIVDHNQVSQVWKHSSHSDCGPNYPWAYLLQQLGSSTTTANASTVTPTPPVGTPEGLAVDGWAGPATVKAIQGRLGFTGANVDGVGGPNTTKAIQSKIGTTVNGVISGQTKNHHLDSFTTVQIGNGGSKMIRDLASAIEALGIGTNGTTVDGLAGPGFVTALQTALNRGLWR